MGITTDTVRPAANIGAGGEERCPACGHVSEGYPQRDGTALCSSGYDMGMGDVDYCPCSDAHHLLRVAKRDRLL